MTRKTFSIGAVLAAVAIPAMLMSLPAAAREHCTTAPASEWKPVHEISAHAAQLGYSVTGVEREGSCYEVDGYDRNGARIEILYNPKSGEPMGRK